MKIIYISLFLLFFGQTFAQVSSYTLDQNDVSAKLTDEGVLFYDPTIGAVYVVPKSSNLSAIYSGAFWFSALDENDEMRVAGALYNQNGQDYYSGPFSNNGSYQNSNYTSKYSNAIWVVTQTEIANHILNYSNSSYVTPPSILNWPGNGDLSLGVSMVLAPFIDVDQDGIYNPSNGDYPCIKGDKAAYIIMNDDAGIHGETGGNPLGIEIHLMIYQINSNNDYLNNSTFINMRVLNKGIHDLTNLKTSFFVDADLGNYSDDHIGCNRAKNVAFTYNMDNDDQAGTSTVGYGSNPPAIGVATLNKPLSGFAGFGFAGNQNQTDPTNAQEFYNYMNGKWKDGTQMVVGGIGYPGSAGSTSTTTNFLFDGYPNNLNEWSEISNNNSPGDRRMFLTVDLEDLAPSQETNVDYVILFSRGNNLNNILNVQYLDYLSDMAKNYYNQNLAESACLFYDQTSVVETLKNELLVYPNPSNGSFTLQKGMIEIQELNLLDELGRKIKTLDVNSQSFQLNLPKGVYFLEIQSANNRMREKVVVN